MFGPHPHRHRRPDRRPHRGPDLGPIPQPQRNPRRIGRDHGCRREVHPRRPDRTRHRQRRGGVIQRDRPAHLFHPPLAHHHDTIGQRHRLQLVMGDVDHRRAQLPVQPGELVPHPHAQFGVQIRQGLVEEQHARPANDGAGDRHALPLPAGQGTRPPVEQRQQVQRPRHRRHPLRDFRLGPARDTQRKRDILRHRQMRIERVGLEHHRQPAVGGGGIGHVAPADRDPPRARLLQPRDQAQQRRFAAPRWPYDDDELAILDQQVGRCQHVHRAKALAQSLDPDARHIFPFFPQHTADQAALQLKHPAGNPAPLTNSAPRR